MTESSSVLHLLLLFDNIARFPNTVEGFDELCSVTVTSPPPPPSPRPPPQDRDSGETTVNAANEAAKNSPLAPRPKTGVNAPFIWAGAPPRSLFRQAWAGGAAAFC